jgi:hypothetical protein
VAGLSSKQSESCQTLFISLATQNKFWRPSYHGILGTINNAIIVGLAESLLRPSLTAAIEETLKL